jgi:hypothetical protein
LPKKWCSIRRQPALVTIDNLEALKRIAEALIEFETIDGAEVDQLIRGEKIVRLPKEDIKMKPTESGEGTATATAPNKPVLA